MISVPNDPSGGAEFTSDSRDCIDIVIAGPGDNTRRPSTGELLKRAKAMRELIDRWGAMADVDISSEIDITISDD